MPKNQCDFIVKRKDGLRICKICQNIIEDDEEHIRKKHPKYLKFFNKKDEEREERYMCCYCGLWVNNWREHMREKHPEIIADAAKRIKPEPEQEEFQFTF